MAKALTMTAAPRVGRKLRSPQHRFQLRHYPFQLQPFLLAPVIPGETLKNALIQSRVVTDPIKNGLIGWWQEYYLFYVNHRDLAGRDDFTAMMLDLDHNMTAYNEAASVPYNHFAGSINWAKLCLQRVTETYFRDEGVAWDAYTIDGLPAAAVNVENWFQSAGLVDNLTTAPDESITVGVDDIVTASEIDTALRTWEFMRANAMTEMSYEDWLATYGIRTPKVELHRPELLRYLREWQYPNNTIDPADGSPASAVSWAVRDRVDKDRFFQEPGFIFGVTCSRPKVYLKNVDGSAADVMNGALSWLPALMKDDPYTSLMTLAADAGPLQTIVTDAEGYVFDVKDLLLYGDDYVNFARTATDANMVSLPSADLSNKDYPSLADVQGLFVSTVAGTLQSVKQDGIVSLSVLGAQIDTTPANSLGS